MDRARRIRFVASAMFLVLLAADWAAAQNSARVIVQFREEVEFEAFARDYAEDERTAASGSSTYHRREVVGAAMSLERKHGFRATNFYSHALKGFAARLTPAQRRSVEADPQVKLVEPDEAITVGTESLSVEQVIPWGIPKIGADINSTRVGDGSGEVNGIPLYIVDTGIDVSHPDLNVVGHISFVSGPNADCNGHGTGVAGIAAARDNSVYSVGSPLGRHSWALRCLHVKG